MNKWLLYSVIAIVALAVGSITTVLLMSPKQAGTASLDIGSTAVLRSTRYSFAPYKGSEKLDQWVNGYVSRNSLTPAQTRALKGMIGVMQWTTDQCQSLKQTKISTSNSEIYSALSTCKNNVTSSEAKARLSMIAEDSMRIPPEFIKFYYDSTIPPATQSAQIMPSCSGTPEQCAKALDEWEKGNRSAWDIWWDEYCEAWD